MGAVDIECLFRYASLFRRLQGIDGLHIVSAVGELDEDDAQILDHREQHFTEALGLCFRGVVKMKFIEFADTVDEQRNASPEFLLDVAQRARRVLEHVVQQRCLDGARIEMQTRENLCDRNGVGDVGLAADAFLALVGLRAELMRSEYAGDIVLRQVGFELRQ